MPRRIGSEVCEEKRGGERLERKEWGEGTYGKPSRSRMNVEIFLLDHNLNFGRRKEGGEHGDRGRGAGLKGLQKSFGVCSRVVLGVWKGGEGIAVNELRERSGKALAPCSLDLCRMARNSRRTLMHHQLQRTPNPTALRPPPPRPSPPHLNTVSLVNKAQLGRGGVTELYGEAVLTTAVSRRPLQVGRTSGR